MLSQYNSHQTVTPPQNTTAGKPLTPTHTMDILKEQQKKQKTDRLESIETIEHLAKLGYITEALMELENLKKSISH